MAKKKTLTHQTLIRVPFKQWYKIKDIVNKKQKEKPKYSNNAWINEAILEKLNKPKLFKCDDFTVGVTAGSDGAEKYYSKGATKIFFEDFIYEKDGVELVYGDIVVAVVKVDHTSWDKEMERL